VGPTRQRGVDESTVQKHERQSNHRISSAPWWKQASDEPMAWNLDMSEQLSEGLWKSWFSFSTEWTAGKKRRSIGSSDGRKIANRDELNTQTPSPDEPTLKPTRQWFIRRWHFRFCWTKSHFWSDKCHTQTNTSTFLDQSWGTTSPLKHSFVKYLYIHK
jgi:hypothetical protein